MFLPRIISNAKAPPIKCQGIKTKLVSFIARNIRWDADGRWIEPFLGSGAVALNIAPPKAYLADTNPHVIKFYKDIQSGNICPDYVMSELTEMGRKLRENGDGYYYEIRDRFNQYGGSLLFIFLNRSCYNGVIRFNSGGKFNVPFCRNINRFTESYISKICNQIDWAYKIIRNSDWVFEVNDWRDTFEQAKPEDFVYCDPPYIGRHTDYYNSWTEDDANELAYATSKLKCGFAVSMWYRDSRGVNKHLDKWTHGRIITTSHFYHVGPTEQQRDSVEEALIISPGNVFSLDEHQV